MAFFLRWIEKEGGEALTSSGFDTRSAAVNRACYMLRHFERKPVSVWIEAEDGRTVMLEPAITMRCTSMQLL